MLEAIIFDFDGLICDTEMPVMQSWQALYREYGLELSIQDWVKCIGTDYSEDTFDPYADLSAQVMQPIDWEVVKPRRYAKELAIVNESPALPGVVALLAEAQANKVKIAVGSSSPHEWVDYHLDRLQLTGYFNTVICADDVARVKPAPDLFRKAAETLQVAPENAVVLEDSPHGVAAAGQLGIFSVAVPNKLTRYLDFNGAGMKVGSIAELSVDLLDRALRNHHA